MLSLTRAWNSSFANSTNLSYFRLVYRIALSSRRSVRVQLTDKTALGEAF
jgi:hypothetical protein